MHALGRSSPRHPPEVSAGAPRPTPREPVSDAVWSTVGDRTSSGTSRRPEAPSTHAHQGTAAATSFEAIRKEIFARMAKALHKTHTGRPSEPLQVVRAGPESLIPAGETSPPAMGTKAWFEHGRRTGVFFTLPAARDVMVHQYPDDWGRTAEISAFVDEYARGLARMNEYVSKMIEGGATHEQVQAVVEKTFSPKTIVKDGDLGAEVEDLVKRTSQFEGIFGSFDTALRTNPRVLVKHFLDETYDDEGMKVFARGMVYAGAELLLENAKALDLAVFEEPDAYKTDLSIAVIRALQVTMGRQLNLSQEENKRLDEEIDRLVNLANDDRDAAYRELAPYLEEAA